MASVAGNHSTIRGRVDRGGRLVTADQPLEDLNRDAGGALGGVLALPQLAAIARLAFRLGVPIERPATLASASSDISCWVRAVPDQDEAEIFLDNMVERPSQGPRFPKFEEVRDQTSLAPSDDFAWACDPDLKLRSLSPALAAVLGLAPDGTSGMALTKLFRLVESADGALPILNGLAARSDFVGQAVVSRTDERVAALITGSARFDADGNFTGFNGRLTLTSDPQAAPLQRPPRHAPIEQSGLADTSLDQLLRLPIERIIAEAEHISGRTDGPLRSDYAGYGGDIAAAARHLLSVLSAMGDDPEFGRGLIDITALAAEAVVLVEPIAEARKVTVELDHSPALEASGEEHAVIQILVNLLVNAIRHSPEDCIVRVSFSDREDWAAITVADQGVGIAPADHKRIFERFERADEQPGGTGLGLAIARRLARSMGGEVSLDSAPGQGARFTLSLPIS